MHPQTAQQINGPQTGQFAVRPLSTKLLTESLAISGNYYARKCVAEECVKSIETLKLNSPESAHQEAEKLLMAYLRKTGQSEVAAAYEAVTKPFKFYHA